MIQTIQYVQTIIYSRSRISDTHIAHTQDQQVFTSPHLSLIIWEGLPVCGLMITTPGGIMSSVVATQIAIGWPCSLWKAVKGGTVPVNNTNTINDKMLRYLTMVLCWNLHVTFKAMWFIQTARQQQVRPGLLTAATSYCNVVTQSMISHWHTFQTMLSKASL